MTYPASPYLRASKWSKVFHSWVSHLLSISHKQKTLSLADLYELLPQYQSLSLTQKLEEKWLIELQDHPEKPSLLRATIHTMQWKPIVIGLLLVPLMLLYIVQPLLLIFLMNFFEPCSTMPVWQAWLLAIGCILTALGSSFFLNYYFHCIQMLALQMSIAYHGLIYRKVLRLSSHSVNTFGSGRIMNILSNDASQIDLTLQYINFLWLAPLDVVIVVVFFWHFVKYIAFLALAYTFVLLIFNSVYGRFYALLQVNMLRRTDERVKVIAELINSMRIVKMYCWEAAFEKRIRSTRKREIFQLALRSITDCVHYFLSSTYIGVAFLLMYGTMWKFDIRFDTRFFAVAFSLLSHVELFLMAWFTAAVRNFAKFIAAEKRIRTFLLLDESQRDRRLRSLSERGTMSNGQTIPQTNTLEHADIDPISVKQYLAVECDLQQARWEQNGSFSLKNISFDAHPGDLICVIGPVGCGKSSLLQTLTGEIAFFDGKVRLRGSFCYVPQESWIFASTIKKNILFGKAYDAELFRRVVQAAAPETDFAQLSDGVNTVVGDQGVMLSGGQKARVNMARALYRNADIYLLDDPLSAVDVKVSKHLFEKSIRSYLRDKICILVTHQIQFLRNATKIIVLDNGNMVQIGTYAELLSSSISFSRLLANIHQQGQDEQERAGTSDHNRSSRRASFIEAENDDILSSSKDFETKKEGSVNWRVYIAYLRAGAGLVLSMLIITLVFGAREVMSVFYNWWLAEWSADEGHRYQELNNCTEPSGELVHTIRSLNETDWKQYQEQKFQIYAGVGLALLGVCFVHIVSVKFMCLNAGRVLHNKILQTIIRCPISFFDLNPAGRILNRFTKDVCNIDDMLPWTFIEFLQSLFQIFGVVGIVTWLNPWSLIPAAVAAVAMLAVRYCFTQCSRDLKRLQNISRSPIYSYLASTIHGLKVIRSYHAEKICSSKFFSYIDEHTRAYYLFLTINRWAAIRFDWIALSFIAVVTILAMIVRITGGQFSAADIALTLTFSLNLTAVFQWTVRQSVEIETQMTSVERVLEYCALEQEPPAQLPPKQRPPINWPSQGQIVFTDVCMSHSTDSHAPLALNHVSLIIQPAQKIGIVGRTGAGKSSFIQTLFRMGTVVRGHITIDDIDIASVGLDDVRRRISIIPQDPVLFTGTMRSNLDQFGDYSDVEIWNALEQVQLKKLVSDVMANGLQSLVSESGSNLSVGQKQLVCLARAILKKSKILVIDEATANVDNATDELIQRAIREQFRECTVLTVAHRLRTVIDSDRILVLGNGSVLEYDTPEVLLSDVDSEFSLLVKQTGSAEAEHLKKLTDVTKFHATEFPELDICNESPSEDDSETDPLLTSISSVI